MDKKLQIILLIFFLSFSLFATIIFFNQPISRFTRAKEDSEPSASNSLVFAYPLIVKADGKSASTINVFIRSENGLPIKNRRVTIGTSLGILQKTLFTTDAQGKATTTLVSELPGTAEINVMFDSVPLAQKLSVKFE